MSDVSPSPSADATLYMLPFLYFHDYLQVTSDLGEGGLQDAATL